MPSFLKDFKMKNTFKFIGEMDETIGNLNKSLDCISIVYMLKTLRRQVTYLLLKDYDYLDEFQENSDLGLGILEGFDYCTQYESKIHPNIPPEKSNIKVSKNESSLLLKDKAKKQDRDEEDPPEDERNVSMIKLNEFNAFYPSLQ